jgi:hypothetical protein
MKISYISLWLLILLHACKSTDQEADVRTIAVDPERCERVEAAEVVDSVSLTYLPLPEHVHFGRVQLVKKTGPYLLALSYATNSLVCFKNGQLLYHLDRQGQGPGEFNSLYTFALDLAKGELVAYDRGLMKFVYMELESGKLKREQKVSYWISTMESFDESNWLITTDVEEKDYVFLLDKERLTDKTPLISSSYQLIKDAVFNQSFSTSDSGLHFLEPFTHLLYTFQTPQKKAKAELRLDFGNKNVPRDYWGIAETEEAEMKIASGQYAFSPMFFTPTKSGFCFFHYYTTEQLRLTRVDEKGGGRSYCIVVNEEVLETALPLPHAQEKGRLHRLYLSDELSEVKSLLGKPLPTPADNPPGLVLLSFGLR